jgi:hypothetical protein
LLPEGLSTKYYTAKLQTRLQNHYGDTIASKKISHLKNDKVHISILSIEKTKKNENN